MVSAFELRIVLIIIAVIIIAAIYVWYRANSKDQIIDEIDLEDVEITDELENIPSLHEDNISESLPDDLRSEFQGVSKQLREETISKRVQDAKQKRAESNASQVQAKIIEGDRKEMLVVFHVVAHEPDFFTGPMIMQMMSELELEHGEMDIFHYNIERFNKKQSVYCVANMLKPGTFDLQGMQDFKTRGLTLILQLPGPEDELKSLNIMIDHAQRFAAYLNGDLLDQDRNPITKQSISLYKEQVQLFGLRATRQSVTA